MGTSKKQREKIACTCECGCKEIFYPFPIYKPKSEGGGLAWPKYIRGHNPNCRKKQFGVTPAWNKGLKKGDHPSIERMGFQNGHPAFTTWEHVNKALKNNPELKLKWLAAKRGKTPWNKNKTKAEYPNGIKSGSQHGNWLGGDGGIRDTSAYQEFRTSIFKRDNYTCQVCGARSFKGRGKTVKLNMHHIIAVSHDKSLIMDYSNVITLCVPCHHATENFGAKAAIMKRDRAKATDLIELPNSTTVPVP